MLLHKIGLNLGIKVTLWNLIRFITKHYFIIIYLMTLIKTESNTVRFKLVERHQYHLDHIPELVRCGLLQEEIEGPAQGN